MKVAFEAETIDRLGSGTGKVGRRLVEHLLRLASGLEITLLRRRRPGPLQDDELDVRCAEVIVPTIRVPRMAEAVSYTWFNLRARQQFDIVHYPRPLVYPFFWRLARNCVVTIHDAGYIMLPAMRDDVGPLLPPPSPTKRLYNGILRRFSHKVAAVFVASEASKAQVEKYYGVPPERIHVAYYAPDEIFRPLPDRDGIRQDLSRRYGIPEHFVLCMGRLQPHKNIRGILRAWAQVGRDIREPYCLVILGRRHWRSDDIFTLAHALHLDTEVIFLEQYVPDEDLVRFLNAAELFVFPSLFEGYGLPLVEALACGAPAVASNATSLPEVAGDAALLVDPRSPEEMAGAIRRALQDDTLRADLSRRAVLQARKFSWEAMATQVLAVYRQLAQV